MEEKKAKEKEQAGKQQEATPLQSLPPHKETEVKNANASGLGSMGRTDGPAPADQKD